MSQTSPTALVTGATDGIGRQTALELGRRGWTVLVHGRSRAKAEAVAAALAAEVNARFVPLAADLGSLAEVRRLAGESLAAAPRLDALVNNAGVFMNELVRSPDGFELTLQVNHLAPFLLTHLLLDRLADSGAGRVVNVSSVAHTRGQIDARDFAALNQLDGYTAYATSKLANVLFTYELARRLGGRRVTVNALHPGVITTKLLQTGFGSTGASLEEGARTSVRLTDDASLAGVTGRYFANAREATSSRESHDRELQRRFYDWSAEQTGVRPLAG